MSVEIIATILLSLLALAIFTFAIAFRLRPHRIDDVILLARKIDISDLELLFDAATEWNLRRSLKKQALREVQEERIRLAREYLWRVAHNASLIHLWLLQEHKPVAWKNPDEYTERDSLIIEALQLVTDLRIYCLAVRLKIWFWTVLQAYRWPMRALPSLPDLRVQYGINVLEKYRRLTELSVALTARYGQSYHDRLSDVLVG